MKKIVTIMLMGMFMLGSVAQASAPSWLSDEAIDILSNVSGFTFDYDEMDDRLGVYVSGKAADYQSGDAYLNSMLEGYGSDALLFEIVCASDSKFTETMTGAIFLVDGTRYIFEIPTDLMGSGFAYLAVGETAADMIRAIVASTNPVKVRYEYSSGNVDFEMSSFQIEVLGNLFTAFEAVGGTKLALFNVIETAQPVIVR